MTDTLPYAGVRTTSLSDRVICRLQAGSTIEAIAKSERISVGLAQLVVDELQRSGMAVPAQSLCASGLGACGGGGGDQVRLHCLGCPLVPLR